MSSIAVSSSWRFARFSIGAAPFAYLAVYLGWGTTYTAIRIGVQSVDPALFLALRFMLAAAILFPFTFLLPAAKREVLSLKPEEMRGSFLQGCLMLIGGLLPVAYAEQYLPSNITALVIGTAPVFFAVFDRALNRVPIRPPVVVSILLGLTGIVLLSGESPEMAPDQSTVSSLWGFALVLVGTAVWSLGSVYSPKLRSIPHPAAHLLIQYLGVGAVLLFIGLAKSAGTLMDLPRAPAEFWWSLVYLALFPSVVSYAAYLWLIRNEPTHRVATYSMVNPLVAAIAGAVVLHEKLSQRAILALALILTATSVSFFWKWRSNKLQQERT